jgi:hypothetical protein
VLIRRAGASYLGIVYDTAFVDVLASVITIREDSEERTFNETSRFALAVRQQMMKAIAALLSLALLASAADAQFLQQLPRRACSQRAAEVAKERDGLFGTHMNFTYESHYNSRLKKCFVLEITTIIEREGETKLMLLRDLFEKEDHGPYAGLVQKAGSDPSQCLVVLVEPVQQRQCRSEQEWRELIKPYMED